MADIQSAPSEEAKAALRESIIHGLRMSGWSRMDAEDEADERIRRVRDKARSE